LEKILTTFFAAFAGTLGAVFKVFLIVLVAGLLIRKKIITNEQINGLSFITINILLPCLIFANIVLTFEPRSMPLWWILPLVGIGMVFVGLLLGILLFRRHLPAKKNMLPLCAIQNAGYLILPLGQALFPGEFDRFANYTFLFLLGVGPLLWSVGKFLTTSGQEEKLRWKGLMTPPLLANIVALVIVFSGNARYIPELLLEPVEMLGQAAVPLANFVLGAVLGGLVLRIKPYALDAVKTNIIKLVLIPLIMVVALLAMKKYNLDPLLTNFLILQAAAAPATGLILQVRQYGGEEQKISSIMLVSYIACMVILPFWVALWNIL